MFGRNTTRTGSTRTNRPRRVSFDLLEARELKTGDLLATGLSGDINQGSAWVATIRQPSLYGSRDIYMTVPGTNDNAGVD